MKNRLLILLTLIIFSSCLNNEYRQLLNGNILSPDKTEYIYFAYEGKYIIFGEPNFISYIKWQPRKLQHGDGKTNAGVYSINDNADLNILYRIKYNSEWSELYIKKELSINNYELENCNYFIFIDTITPFIGYYDADIKSINKGFGINENIEIIKFMEYLNNNEIFDYEIWGLLRNPFHAIDRSDGFAGYIYGFFDEIKNIAIGGTVWLNKNDELFYLVMNRRLFLLNIEWLEKLGYNKERMELK